MTREALKCFRINLSMDQTDSFLAVFVVTSQQEVKYELEFEISHEKKFVETAKFEESCQKLGAF